MVLFHRVQAVVYFAQRVGQGGGRVGLLQPRDDAGQCALDIVQPPLHCRIGAFYFQPGDALFDPLQRTLVAGFALCQLRQVVGAVGGLDLDPLLDLVQGGRGELEGILDAGDPHFQSAGGVLGVGARLSQAGGELFQVAGERGDLGGGLMGGLADLVGKPRQALVQALDRILQAILMGIAFQPFQPLGQAEHMAAQLVEGLGLFAAGDVDFAGGLAHRPVVFGLAAFGAVETAADIAQLVFDAAIGIRGFGLGPADAGQHVFGVAAAGGGHRQTPGVQARTLMGIAFVGGGAFKRHGLGLLSHVGKAAQDTPGQPFADRQPLAPCRGTGGFPRFGRDAGYIPGKFCAHSESPAPAARYRR